MGLDNKIFKRIVPKHSKSGNLFLLVTDRTMFGNAVLDVYMDKYGERDNVVFLPTYTTDARLVEKFYTHEMMYLPRRHFMTYVDGGKMAEHHELRGQLYGTPFSAVFNLVINQGKNAIKVVSKPGACKLHQIFPDLEVGIGLYPMSRMLKKKKRPIFTPPVEAVIYFKERRQHADAVVHNLHEIVMKYNAIRNSKA